MKILPLLVLIWGLSLASPALFTLPDTITEILTKTLFALGLLTCLFTYYGSAALMSRDPRVTSFNKLTARWSQNLVTRVNHHHHHPLTWLIADITPHHRAPGRYHAADFSLLPAILYLTVVCPVISHLDFGVHLLLTAGIIVCLMAVMRRKLWQQKSLLMVAALPGAMLWLMPHIISWRPTIGFALVSITVPIFIITFVAILSTITHIDDMKRQLITSHHDYCANYRRFLTTGMANIALGILINHQFGFILTITAALFVFGHVWLYYLWQK